MSYKESWKANFALAGDAVFEGLNHDFVNVMEPSKHGEMFDMMTAPARIPFILGYMVMALASGAVYATSVTMPWNINSTQNRDQTP